MSGCLLLFNSGKGGKWAKHMQKISESLTAAWEDPSLKSKGHTYMGDQQRDDHAKTDRTGSKAGPYIKVEGVLGLCFFVVVERTIQMSQHEHQECCHYFCHLAIQTETFPVNFLTIQGIRYMFKN